MPRVLLRNLVASLWIGGLGCGGSQLASYEPKEIEIRSQSAIFDLAVQHLINKEARLLEEDPQRGLISTQWETVEGKEFQLQVLISPVSTVVRLECRIKRGMELEACPPPPAYPKSLIRQAQELSDRLEAGIGAAETAM